MNDYMPIALEHT